MTKYEAFKAYLLTLDISWEEYERRLIEWCRKNKY